MRHTYRFDTVPELRGATLDVTQRGRFVSLRPRGFGSLRLLALTCVYFFWMDLLRPIEVSDDGLLYSLYIPPLPSAAHNRQVEGYLRKWLAHDPAPMAVTIAVTGRCQYACEHCSDTTALGQRRELSTDELRRVIAQSLDLGVQVVTFTGGEPLLRDDLEEVVASVPREQAVTLAFTNALLLDAPRARLLKRAGLFGVHISLDSPDPVEHDRLRGHDGAFAGVERGVHAALDAGLKVGISTYATNASVESSALEGVVTLARDWGVHEVSVFDVIATGRLLGRDDAHLSPANHERLVRQASRLTRRCRRRPRVVTQSWTNSGRAFSKYIGCLAAGFQFHVTTHGDVTPCDFTPLSFGNVIDDALADIWHRMTAHHEYCRHSQSCRMQDGAFRSRYIDAIPAGARLPYPIDDITPDVARG